MIDKKRTINYTIYGGLFTIIFGGILHFIYEFSGENTIVGIFAPVNESVWEHMKLVFTPFLIFGIYEYFTYFKIKTNNYFLAHVIQQYFAIAFIIGFFYFYNLFLNESLFLDILSFVIAVILARWLFYYIIIKKIGDGIWQTISIIFILILFGFIILATFNPPKINMFKDSNTNRYGIYKIN